jgi:hypothetical protein
VSISRPTHGLIAPPSRSAPEKMPKKTLAGRPSAAAIGAPRIAGR